MADTTHLPLDSLTVLDLCNGPGASATRLLADLGADVIRVEPRAGSPARTDGVLVGSHSLTYAVRQANKRVIALDLDRPGADLDEFFALAARADIVFEDSRPAQHASNPVRPEVLRGRFDSLVIVSVTDFGQTGPYRDWVATEPVLLALNGELSRSGLPGRPPLLPPVELATESAAVQAAWCALLAYLRRLDTGSGQIVDFSMMEAATQALDPAWGVGGSATGGRTAVEGPRGRPDARNRYPVFACRDGYVRLCILSPRQWQGMFTWMGEPEEFSDPGLAAIPKRFKVIDKIHAAIGAMFADRSRAEIVEQGRRHGVPAAAMLEPHDVFEIEQYDERGAFTWVDVDGRTARVPDGLVEIDGVRAGTRTAAPTPDQHGAQIRSELATPRATGPAEPGRLDRDQLPLAGLRVLDLGVIVVGAETGRLMADMGAQVIKVENTAFPDGNRQSIKGDPMTWSFAWGCRNKLGLGINLRSPEGIAVFKELAATADVVLSNFKPGTMESLGIGYDVLSQINPGIVMADSSAFGPTGPWSRRMGYGPLVRAETGLSMLWSYPAADGSEGSDGVEVADGGDGFSDASTIYPDHTAGRVGAVAVLALLLRRRATGHGGTVSVAQAEVVLSQMAAHLGRDWLSPGSLRAPGNSLDADAGRGVYPCAGDDEWVVITSRDTADFAALAQTIGRPEWADDPDLGTVEGRLARRTEIDAAVARWTGTRSPQDAAQILQSAGVPAGRMARPLDLLDDPHLRDRKFFRTMTHPLMSGSEPTENQPAVFESMPPTPLEPAPLAGQHTREILSQVLGYSDQRLDELIELGALQETLPQPTDATVPNRR
ncbi:CaiB/BaiF CoA-transferase family protein [Williamsia sp. CHRR-6]|uniref:CaiB/BaiF CoA transferase family protein n=1 Tax=Williamsia sp. CHRR-6 TaxID=2835871 RepID=UPI001BDA8F5D|nr:CoA transferase [Williamsia sp. CHRR-6]MBT0566416.1 CoA transferase [Williamsia sp. CHRR-6]